MISIVPPLNWTLSSLPTKIVVWRQGFFLSFVHNYAPLSSAPLFPLTPTLGSVARISHSPWANNVPFRVDEEGHSCQGRQESREESNHSITLCPRLSQLLPKHPNSPPRSLHQRLGAGLQSQLQPCSAQRATVSPAGERHNLAVIIVETPLRTFTILFDMQ